MGGEEVIEETFVDVFCDLVYGGGWMDAERLEDIDRDCSWALVMHICTLFNNAHYCLLCSVLRMFAVVVLKKACCAHFVAGKLASLELKNDWEVPAWARGIASAVAHPPKSFKTFFHFLTVALKASVSSPVLPTCTLSPSPRRCADRPSLS